VSGFAAGYVPQQPCMYYRLYPPHISLRINTPLSLPQFTHPTPHSRHPKGWFYTHQLITLKRQTANSTTTPPQKPLIPLLAFRKRPILRIEPMNSPKPSTNIFNDGVLRRCEGISKPQATVSMVRDTLLAIGARVSKHHVDVLKRYARSASGSC
jgi:hypothetical protein